MATKQPIKPKREPLTQAQIAFIIMVIGAILFIIAKLI